MVQQCSSSGGADSSAMLFMMFYPSTSGVPGILSSHVHQLSGGVSCHDWWCRQCRADGRFRQPVYTWYLYRYIRGLRLCERPDDAVERANQDGGKRIFGERFEVHGG